MSLLTFGGSNIDAEINGNIIATDTNGGGDGIAAGLLAVATGGDANVDLMVGPNSSVSGSAAGVVGIAGVNGTSNVDVYGNVNQTSTSVSFLPTLDIPVGVAAVTAGTGDATVTTYDGSLVTQDGAGGVGVAAAAFGSGSATATVGDDVESDGLVGVLALSGTGSASANLFGGNVLGSSTPAPVIGVGAVVLGGTEDANVTVGDGVAQDSSVDATGVALLGLNLGTGDVNISSETPDPDGDDNVISSDGIGVLGLALGGGDTNIDTGLVNADDAGVVGVGNNVTINTGETNSGGLGVAGLGGGTVNITTGDTTSNTNLGGGLGGSGVVGASFGGDVNVTTEGKTTVASTSAADAGLIGVGALSIGGNATVTVNGAIDPPIIGALSVAIGPGTATTTVNAMTQAWVLGAGAVQLGGGSGDAIVETNAAIESDVIGVGALNAGGDGDIDIDVNESVSGFSGANVGFNAIQAVSLLNSGDVFVNTGLNGTLAADNDGIQVSKLFGDGNVEVGAEAAINAGDEGIEVLSLLNDGNIVIGTGTAAPITAGDDGISALKYFGDGNISVEAGSGIIAGDDGIETVAIVSEGNISITTLADATISAGDNGIGVLKLLGDGNVMVEAGADITAGDDGIQTITAFSEGDVSITTLADAAISAGDDGIFVDKSFGDGNVTVEAGAGITATGDDGIEAVVFGSDGNVNIATSDGGTTGDGSDGGVITAGDDGISVTKIFGAGNIGVDVNADINAADEGIDIFRTLSGGAGSTIDVSVDGTSTVVAGDNGIEIDTPFALNDINVSVGTGSEVIADDGSAVTITSFSVLGDNDITVTSDGLLRGEGTFFEPVVFVGTDGTAIVNNASNGMIMSDTGAWDDNAISVLAGNDIQVYNSGDVYGNINATSFNSFAFVENSGYWATSGFNNVWAQQSAYIQNSGVIETDGITLFSFSSVSGQTFVDNDGEIYVNGFTSFGGPIFGIDEFANDGLLSMVNGTSDYGLATIPVYNSGVGDVTVVAGNFVGNPDSRLAVDAELGGVGTSSSDLLVITGDVDGQTEVYVNNVGGFGAYNPVGIPVVGVLSGNTDLGDFVLANGPIDTGLFSYDLFLDAPSDPAQWTPGFAPATKGWVLASYADSSAYMFAQAASIAQNMWHTTADGYIDRSSDLREIYGSTGTGVSTANADFIEAAPPPAAPAVNNNGNGVWMRGIGQYAESEGSQSFEAFPGQFVSFNTDYNETLWGIEGGVDHAFHMNNGSTLVLGLMGGYVTNSVEFSGLGDEATIDGGMAGIYATWVNGPGYIDALFKADFLTADFSVGGAPASTDILNLGGRIEGGYRFTNAGGYYIEPVASIAYVSSDLDDLNVLGTPVSINSDDSLRGKIGGRVGASMMVGNGKMDPYINAYVGGEFLGDNSAVISGLTLQDDISGVFGEVGAGFNWYDAANSWSVYGQANYIFADDYWAANGTMGVRYSW
ncbi:autotransporter domain-containing protein [Hoeflea sp. WL0058]|uniref:Autotransporter domain-containing protein n=1 Tax=Flavimaribacter sediminis TaxID=2865987 RepID=A0AAE2ZJS7_9HYPH|nr:autotransporter domain-containing protein [Flavimaribacter sediminis]MBW8637803.1 autotransporter domain-containing protein [Flavimaribacter sediminis]